TDAGRCRSRARMAERLQLADACRERASGKSGSFSSFENTFMLRCAVLTFSVSTAFRRFLDPIPRRPAGAGAGLILIADSGDRLAAILSKNSCRFGYNI